MVTPFTIPVPVDAKLSDDVAVQKLIQRVEELKQSYRPRCGWLDAPENAIHRQGDKQ